MFNIYKFLEKYTNINIDQNHQTIQNYSYKESMLIIICVLLGLIALIEFFIIIFLANKKR